MRDRTDALDRSTVAIVLGTRPEIIKLAPVIRAFKDAGVSPLIIHTNQHYSENMDRIFFEELELPEPAVNLRVGSAGHGVQTGLMMQRLEPVLSEEHPAAVLVQGDTNSVLAGALTASKLGIKVGHVEAGLRSEDREMPEELNRLVTDHISEYLYAPTQASVDQLLAEGIPKTRVSLTGNTIVDACRQHLALASAQPSSRWHEVIQKSYALVTIHRQENTHSLERLRGLVAGLLQSATELDISLCVPLHPRTKGVLEAAGLYAELVDNTKLVLSEPLGYSEFLVLLQGARLVFTDSGGVQEEACILDVPCVTLRDSTERGESVTVGANRLAGFEAKGILQAAREAYSSARGWVQPYGDGRAGVRIVEHVLGSL